MCYHHRSHTEQQQQQKMEQYYWHCRHRSSSCCCSTTTTVTTAAPTPRTTRARSSTTSPFRCRSRSLIRIMFVVLMIYCFCCCWHSVHGNPAVAGASAAWIAEINDDIDDDQQQQLLFPLERRVVRRMPEQHQQQSVASSRGAALGWRKGRYYVGRWGSGGGSGAIGGQRRRAVHSRRFVPLPNNDESLVVDGRSIIEHDEVVKQQQRLCGLKLANRTKQLCGDCVPANMRQVILLDKKHGHHGGGGANPQAAFSKERLTEMCCVQRCTDEQIRNFCCRGRT